MKVAVGLRRVAAGKRTSGRRAAQIAEDMAKRFYSMFWGREDVFAKRSRSGAYFPQCDNRWKADLCPKMRGEKAVCSECKNQKWTRLDAGKIVAHLLGYKEDGSDVIGVYPLLQDGTCRFLVFDFDNHEKGAEAADLPTQINRWQEEVDALRRICQDNGIHALTERFAFRQRSPPVDIL